MVNKIKLEKDDFGRFEVVPDEVLYRDELSPEKFKELVYRFIRTESNDVRDHFLERMATGLWHAMRKEMIRLHGDRTIEPTFTNEDHKRISDLLRHEFNDDVFYFGGDVSGFFGKERETERLATTEEGESRYETAGRFGSFGSSLWGRLELPFREIWRFSPKLNVSVSKNSNRTETKVTKTKGNETSVEPNNVEATPRTVSVGGRLALFRIDDKLRFQVEGDHKQVKDALPDQLKDENGLKGSLSVRKPGNTPFSMNASASWRRKGYTEPDVDDYGGRMKNEAYISAEPSYQFSKVLGIVGMYDYSHNESHQHFYRSNELEHDGSILGQFKIGEEYLLRAGLGGGAWRSASERLDISDSSAYDGAELHLRGSLDLKLSKSFRMNIYGKTRANYVEGTLNGWYPSENMGVDLKFSTEHLTLKVGPSWSGYQRNLRFIAEEGDHFYSETGKKKRQTNNSAGLATSVELAPAESFVWNTALNLSYEGRQHFKAYDAMNVDGSTELRYRLFRDPATVWLYLNLEGGCGDYRNHFTPSEMGSWYYFNVFGGISLDR